MVYLSSFCQRCPGVNWAMEFLSITLPLPPSSATISGHLCGVVRIETHALLSSGWPQSTGYWRVYKVLSRDLTETVSSNHQCQRSA